MEARNLRKERTGVVLSNKMDKTITVAAKFKECRRVRNPDTSSAGSCNKFRKFLQQVPIHALTIPVEVVPARTPAHALKELVLFEKHKFH